MPNRYMEIYLLGVINYFIPEVVKFVLNQNKFNHPFYFRNNITHFIFIVSIG